MAKIAEATVLNRTMLFFLSMILTCIFGSGIFKTTFDSSLSALLSKSDPYLNELEEVDRTFPSNGEIRFAFIAEKNNSVFDRKILLAIADLTEKFTVIPKIQGITTILGYTSPETQRRLFSEPINDLSDSEIAEIGETARNERFLTSNLLSPDASLTFAIIDVNTREATNTERIEIADSVLELKDQLKIAHPTVNVLANSDVILEKASQQDMVDDLTKLMPLVIILCVAVICYCFKSLAIGACILIHVAFTIICTVGVLGFFNLSFNNISVIAPLVVVIISVANSVHIISIFKQGLHQNKNDTDAMIYSMQSNLRPVTLAAITTAIGFTSLSMSSSPAIQDFGRIVSVGIGFAYMLTVFMLPYMLVRISKISSVSKASGVNFLQPQLRSIIKFATQNDKAIFSLCTALAVFTFILLPLNQTDFNRLDFIASDSEIREYYDVVEERMNRGLGLSYAIETNTKDRAIDPFFLQKTDEFTNWLSEQKEIESVISIVEVIKTINRIISDNDEQKYSIPTEIQTNENYLNAYKTVEDNFIPLNRFIDEDYSAVTVVINAREMSNQQMIDLDQRITKEFSENFPSASLVHGSGVLLFARMDELVTIELLQGYSISLLLITICLTLGFKSLYFGLLSVIPNLLPATMVFGFWALLVGQLDPFVMMLFSISIGLVVDDTVHILSHYLENRRDGIAKVPAIGNSITTAGPALTITTMVLALGTTVLIFANTLYFQQSAKLLVPIVVLALVLDLFYLPSILKRFDSNFKKQKIMTS